jgi:multidrug efflux pump subunit AcrA (membrane-fusion protein)
MMKRHRTTLIVAALLIPVLGGLGYWGSRRLHRATPKDQLPVVEVKRGTLNLNVFAQGELSARKEIMLSAPSIGGDSLQITYLAGSGHAIAQGDTVFEFDPSEQHYKLEQSRSEMQQAEQQIVKAKADAAVLAAQDKVALLKARYDVRRAELDVQKNELVSRIDGTKNQLALDQARRALAELESDIKSHDASGQATIYLAQEKTNKARIIMEQAQQNLDKMKVVAPMSGLTSVQKNQNASGGFYFTGMNLPYYHSGDQVQPGSALVKIVDSSDMELKCKVKEHDRGNVRPDSPVEIIFDAIPEKTFHGTVSNIAEQSVRRSFGEGDAGAFEVRVTLRDADPRLHAGFTANIVFLGADKPNMLLIPRQALFRKDGKRVVFVKNASGYEQREVKVLDESESRASIEGLPAGTVLAMIDPTAPRKNTNSAPGTPGGAL